MIVEKRKSRPYLSTVTVVQKSQINKRSHHNIRLWRAWNGNIEWKICWLIGLVSIAKRPHTEGSSIVCGCWHSSKGAPLISIYINAISWECRSSGSLSYQYKLLWVLRLVSHRPLHRHPCDLAATCVFNVIVTAWRQAILNIEPFARVCLC